MLRGGSEFSDHALMRGQCDAVDRETLRTTSVGGGGIPDCLLITVRKKLITKCASFRRSMDEEVQSCLHINGNFLAGI